MSHFLRESARKLSKLRKLVRRKGPRRALMRHRVAASTEHDAVLASIAPPIVVDVGANRGQFSLAVRHLHAGARIIAFEPLPGPAAIFRGVFAGDENTALRQSAISQVRGIAEMHVSRQMDSSSILPISSRQTSLFPGTEEVATIQVPAAPLSELLGGDDLGNDGLLKIDVQGFELEVLKSAVPVLAFFRHVYVEASFVTLYDGQALAYQVIDFLHAHGFALDGIHNLVTDRGNGQAVQCDMLFVRRTA